jgi:hypothetical protein
VRGHQPAIGRSNPDPPVESGPRRAGALAPPDPVAAGPGRPGGSATAEDVESFVIAGLVSDIDTKRGSVLVGDRVVWAPAHVMRGLDPGTSVIVSGRRDTRTGRAIAELVRRTRLILNGPPRPPQSTAVLDPGDVAGEPHPIALLVASLLRELGREAELLECRLLPSDDQYAIFLQIPREVGKGVLVPRRMLERALGDTAARGFVRNLLRAAVEALRSRRAISEARVTAYFAALSRGSIRGPHCAHCEGPFLAEDAMLVREGSPWHLVCPPAW